MEQDLISHSHQEDEGLRAPWRWTGGLMDLQDALCNLEISLLEGEPPEDVKRYLDRAKKRWNRFCKWVEDEGYHIPSR